MLEILKQKRKYMKYEQIVFVDGENVGYKSNRIPENIYFFIFTNHGNINKTIFPNNVQIININSIKNKVSNKSNCLDFCLVTQLSAMLPFIKNKKITILSNDGGYDSVILYLKNNMPNLDIERYGLSLDSYVNFLYFDLPDWLIPLTQDVLEKISWCNNMMELKGELSQKQKKKFTYCHKIVPISNIIIDMTYDIYTKLYCVRASGQYRCSYKELSEAKEEFDRIFDELTKMSQHYQNHEQYKKAKKMKIESYIEESVSLNQPLIYNLMNHFDENKAIQIFNEFVNA